MSYNSGEITIGDRNMVSSNVQEEILNQLTQLSIEQQRLVLEYALNLSVSEVKGVSGKNLLRFSGIFSQEDADTISKKNELDCERVDVDEW